MKHTLAVVAFLCPLLICCQSRGSGNPPYTIGDKLPSLTVAQVLNSPASSLSLASFSDRLLIINFMATTCRSCIEKLPEMDSLQQQYGGRVQFLLVTGEDRGKVQTFLSKRFGKGLHLPVVVGDTVLHRFFPHQFISHEVWVSQGVVTAITGSQYVNSNNIDIVLSGRRPVWPVKRDITEYNYTQSLLAVNSANLPEESYPAAAFYTAVTGWLDGVPARYTEVRDTARGTLRVSAINTPLLPLLLRASGMRADFPVAAMVFHVKDSARFIYNAAKDYRNSWLAANSYCYEAVVPITWSAAAIRQKLAADLAQYLGLTAVEEQREDSCLVLVRKGAGSKPLLDRAEGTAEKLTSLSNLLYRLNATPWGLPVLDESGLVGRHYLHLPEAAFASVPALQAALAPYGLALERAHRVQQRLVITETAASFFNPQNNTP